MRSTIERNWVALRDSDAWRRVASPLSSTVVAKNGAVRSIGTARRYVATAGSVLRPASAFADVKTFVLFIGHVKSGGTMMGALLDAHRNAVVADEIDVLRYVAAGFDMQQIYRLLEKGARREAMKGRVTARRLDPYSFAVPGQSQGSHDDVHVIGDSRAGPTTRRLGREPHLIERLDRTLDGVDVRFVHVVRNPFDPISAMVRRGKRTHEEATADYAAQCGRVDDLCRRVTHQVLRVHYEAFVDDPTSGLRRLCDFVRLECRDDYLAACAAVIQRDRPGERHTVSWSREQIAAVERLIDDVPFLQGYTYGPVAR
ncbi:MAG TPA: sulfotransferase [Acidimicrobiales bacterium]|nr:sulfotransferase [Acidimicrobiales bacterium]